MSMSMPRRNFLSVLGSLSAAAALPGIARGVITTTSSEAIWNNYRNALVIDSLGSIGNDRASFGAADFADAKSSGLTAINVTVNGASVGSYARNFNDTVRSIAFYNAQIAARPDAFMQIRRAADLTEAKRSGKLGLIYGFQDATPIGEDLDRVDMFANFGVRVFQLTYNRRNLVGDGCLESGNAGLSEFGRKLVARLNERKQLIDLSHAGERTTLEAVAASKAPIAISHTGCAALTANPRNKTDNELRKVAERGGYVGIYLMPFLRSQGQPMAADVIAHLEHALDVCGEDHVGIGSDGPIAATVVTPEFKKEWADEINDRRKRGISAPGEDPNVYAFIPDLNRTDRFGRIAELLSARKHSDERIAKILGGNFARLLQDVW
ncbi:MAG: membrane dipeptidase [Rudaea sp.]|nr:membrane dipeptidase [Rudaea sp.]